MSTSQISRRYARALFDLIQDGTDVREDLASVASAACEAQVAALLASPEYPAALKQTVIIKSAGDEISAEVVRLVGMLAERNKAVLLPEIATLVEEMIHEAESELEAEVTVASPIDEAMQGKLSKALEASTGKKVRLSISEDKTILGGMVVRIGDRKIDYSLRTKLTGLGRALAS